jgi:hypothetical protein
MAQSPIRPWTNDALAALLDKFERDDVMFSSQSLFTQYFEKDKTKIQHPQNNMEDWLCVYTGVRASTLDALVALGGDKT